MQFVSICQTAVSITKENAGTTESLRKTLSPQPKMALRLVICWPATTTKKKNLKQFTPLSVVVDTCYIIPSIDNKTSRTEQSVYRVLKSAPTYHFSLKSADGLDASL